MGDGVVERLTELEQAVRRAAEAIGRLREENAQLKREVRRLTEERRQVLNQVDTILKDIGKLDLEWTDAPNAFFNWWKHLLAERRAGHDRTVMTRIAQVVQLSADVRVLLRPFSEYASAMSLEMTLAEMNSARISEAARRIAAPRLRSRRPRDMFTVAAASLTRA